MIMRDWILNTRDAHKVELLRDFGFWVEENVSVCVCVCERSVYRECGGPRATE